MLYIPCVEFQFCICYVQLPFEEKVANLVSKGGRDSGKGCECPPPPDETLTNVPIVIKLYSLSILLIRPSEPTCRGY